MTRTTKARQTRIERQVKATMERLYPKVEEKSSREMAMYIASNSFCRFKRSIEDLKNILEKFCQNQKEILDNLDWAHNEEKNFLILGRKFDFYSRTLENYWLEIKKMQGVEKWKI